MKIQKIMNYAADGMEAYRAGDIETFNENVALFIKAIEGISVPYLHSINEALKPCEKCEQCKRCTKYFAKRAKRELKKALKKEVRRNMKIRFVLDYRDAFGKYTYSYKYMNKKIKAMFDVIKANVSYSDLCLLLKKEPRLNEFNGKYVKL